MLRWIRYPFWNDAEARLRAGWRILVQLVVLTLLWWAPQVGIAKVKEATEAHREAIFSHGAAFMVSTVAVLVSVAVGARFLDRRSLEGVGLMVRRGTLRDAIFGAALGAVLMGGVAGVELAMGVATYGPLPESSGPVPQLAFLPMAGFLFLAVALIEEAVFRGYHLTNLAEGLAGRWLDPARATGLAVLLSSFAFGLAHANNPHAGLISTANIVIAGGMLALAYVATGELAIAVGLHFGWNFFQNALDMPVSGQVWFDYGALVEREVRGPEWLTGGDFGPEAGLTGLGAMIVGTALIAAWIRLTRGRLRIDPRFGRWREIE